MRNAHATMPPRSCFESPIVPATVPPVARRSSTMRTFAPGWRASLCISSVADPYSRSYSTDTTSAGSFPSLRTGTNPTPSLYAIGAPKMKPRDSIPTTASTFRGPIRSSRPSMAALNESPSLRSVVMSLNRIPGFGKSGTSRILLARSFVCTATGLESTVRAAAVKLDVQTHYYPPAYFERIERGGGDFSFGTSPTGQRIIRYKGARFFGITAPMTDVAQRVADMDRVGIDVEVVSLSTPNVFFAEGKAQTDVARMVNDAYADLVAKHPG